MCLISCHTSIFFPLFPFIQSIPGQEDLSRWFEEKMSNPEALHEEFRNRDTKLRTLIHGDLWHNNIFFKASSAHSVRGGNGKLMSNDRFVNEGNFRQFPRPGQPSCSSRTGRCRTSASPPTTSASFSSPVPRPDSGIVVEYFTKEDNYIYFVRHTHTHTHTHHPFLDLNFTYLIYFPF